MEENGLKRIGTQEGREIYCLGFVGTSTLNNYDADTSTVFDEQDSARVKTIGTDCDDGKRHEYVMWGDDDQFPYMVRNRIGDNMVTAQCQLFNAQTTYAQGLCFYDRDTKGEVTNPEFEMFNLINNLKQTYMEMSVDIVNYYFSVVVFVLDRQKKNIVHIHQKEAQNCRIDPDKKYILYGNFEAGADITQKKEYIPLLDINHPIEDFLQRTGRIPNKSGLKIIERPCKYAMILRYPTVGFQYYPHMTYLSIFRDNWYDIYRLIGEGKRIKIKNSASPRFLVEIQKEYWDMLCDNEGIYDPKKRVERIEKEKKNIEDFVCGLKNSGKTWITGAYVDPNGKEISMVKVTNIENGKKEGGDWADDIQEAANIQCFALGVHPNLIGATPGKSQMNNSGSDKRELFTLKETLMTSFRDVLLPAFHLLLYFNGWQKEIGVKAPIIQLTTTDEHKDEKEVEVTSNEEEGGNS